MSIKRLYLILFMFTISISYSVPKEKTESFENYFNKDYSNYDFLVQNPMFYLTLHVTDMSELKNKYLLVTTEEYELDENGKKYYGDGDIWDCTYTYYKFDDNGRIEKEYYLLIDSNGTERIVQYSLNNYENSEYSIKTIDLLNNEEELENLRI